MVDTFSATKRRRIMQAIRGKDTKPEVIVQRLLRSLQYRFRAHGRNLPGRPDIVFESRRKVIFIHGCFWHRHNCHKGRSVPSTRVAFWSEKLGRNRLRDSRIRGVLQREGWSVLTVWECQISERNAEVLERRLRRFLESRSPKGAGRREFKRARASLKGWRGPKRLRPRTHKRSRRT